MNQEPSLTERIQHLERDYASGAETTQPYALQFPALRAPEERQQIIQEPTTPPYHYFCRTDYSTLRNALSVLSQTFF